MHTLRERIKSKINDHLEIDEKNEFIVLQEAWGTDYQLQLAWLLQENIKRKKEIYMF